MSKIKNENYILITGFMVNELGLKGNELLIYAIIYGFTQAEGQTFNGSLQYLADWTNSTKQGVLKNLKSLIDKGYISKKKTVVNGVNIVEYYSTKFNGGIKQSLMGGIKQSLTNNIDIYNIDNNIEYRTKRFSPPDIDAVKSYCRERKNNVDAQRFVDYYTANGWKVGKARNPMRDWKAAIRTWERNDKSNKPSYQPNYEGSKDFWDD